LQEPVEGEIPKKFNKFRKVKRATLRLRNAFRYAYYDLTDGGGVVNTRIHKDSYDVKKREKGIFTHFPDFIDPVYFRLSELLYRIAARG